MNLRLIATFFAAIAACAPSASADPVVLELFTSEGCSSCPPADALLRDLGERDDVIILAWHVDYWDRLGWTDPFGDSTYTERQRRYAKSMNLRSLYTPQMIVNGKAEFVGSDRARALREIDRAEPFAVHVRIPDARLVNGEIRAEINVDGAHADARMLLIVTEDGLVTPNIPRGENRGKTLQHDGVVRRVETLSITEAEKQTITVPVDDAWSAARLTLVVLVEPAEGTGLRGAAQAKVRK